MSTNTLAEQRITTADTIRPFHVNVPQEAPHAFAQAITEVDG